MTETECLLRGTFYILRFAHTVCLCVLCGSENKQQLFHYTTLTDWFVFMTETGCLLRGTDWVFIQNRLSFGLKQTCHGSDG
jgi:hypothetical protein